MGDDYPLYDKVFEAVGKFRADTGEQANTVTLHPVTKIWLGREVTKMEGGDPVDLLNFRVAKCRVLSSLTCPKDQVLVAKV